MPEYSCRGMPTIEAFFDSDAFIRGLMGPFGCLPGDAEFLTPLGWKRMAEFSIGDVALQWSPSGTAEWVTPTAPIEAPCDEMLLFENQHFRMALSLEHRVPHWDYLGRFKVSTAEDVARSTTRKTIPTTFMTPSGGLGLSEAEIRYRVMMQADGHFPDVGQQANVTVRRPRKVKRVPEILAGVGITPVVAHRADDPAETIFRFYPPDRRKHFPRDWYKMSAAELEIVLDEALLWDGLANSPERRYFGTHKQDMDFLQFASHAVGRRAIMSRSVYEQDGWKNCYRIHARVPGSSKNTVQIREHTSVSLIEPPNGMKYCFAVPSGFFVARYCDSVFITGNSGKSVACSIEIAQRGMGQAPGPDGRRRSRFAVIRNTLKQLEDTTERTFLQWFPPIQFGDWVPSKHNYTLRALKGPGDDRNAEIEVMFRALDRPDQVGDLLSMELTGAWVNEGREVPWAVTEAITGRVGRFPARRDGGATWSGVWSDTNPPDVDSDWFKFFEEQDHTEAVADLAKVIPGMTVENYCRIFKQPSGRSVRAENVQNVPLGYYQRLAIGKSQEWVKVYVDGEYGFVTDGKPVWPEYNDAIHCPADERQWPRPNLNLPIQRGWDFGLTPACIYSQITARGQWIVFDEQVATSMGADRFSDEVLDHSARYYPGADFRDVGDPAGNERGQSDERTCFQILHGKNILIEPGLQTLEIRLESVRKPLRTLVDGRPQFQLHPRCKKLRRGMMGGYHWRRMKVSGERYAPTPEKDQYSHPCDGLGYTGTRLFGVGLYLPKGNDNARGSNQTAVGSRSRVTGY